MNSHTLTYDEKLHELEKYPIEDFLEEDFLQDFVLNKQNKINN